MASAIMDEDRWEVVTGFEFSDVTYHRAKNVGAVRIAFDRPAVRNAFTPHTVDELYTALDHARKQTDVGCVLLTGNGPSPKDGGWAFCSGGDQSVRGESGYEYHDDAGDDTPTGGPDVDDTDPDEPDVDGTDADELDVDDTDPDELDVDDTDPDEPDVDGTDADDSGTGVGRLHILEVQRLIRFMPKPVIAVVPGWAVGGGHSLHVVCDLTLASAEHARFLQTDPDVASFDAGYGSAYLAKQIGQKKAREVFFLGKTYDAAAAAEMGMVNEVVPHDDLEAVALEWAAAIEGKSPTAIRMLKFAFNAVDDGLVGQQVFAGEATRLGYMTDEAKEGRDAFLEKREPDYSGYPWFY